VYTNTPETARFVKKFLPTADYKYLQDVLESRGLDRYNEWEFLRNTGDDLIKISDTLPSNSIVYASIT
jgi:hypothetical protein